MAENEKGAADPRRLYLLRVASHIFGLNIVEEKLRNTQPLSRFCDSGTQVLVLTRNEVIRCWWKRLQKGGIDLMNEMKAEGSGQKVVFYKTRAVQLGNEDFKVCNCC